MASFHIKTRSTTSLHKRHSVTLTPLTQTRIDKGIITVRYEEALPAKPPIAVTVPPPTQPPTDLHPALRTTHNIEEERKRDSGLANTTSSRCEDRLPMESCNSLGTIMMSSEIEEHLGLEINFDSPPAKISNPLSTNTRCLSSSLPLVDAEVSGSSRSLYTRAKPNVDEGTCNQDLISPIQFKIPTENWLEDNFIEKLSFSKRGSIMADGRKSFNDHVRPNSVSRKPISSTYTDMTDLTADTEWESHKVRSMYEQGTYTKLDWAARRISRVSNYESQSEVMDKRLSSRTLIAAVDDASSRLANDPVSKNEHELAGGLEDWEDINAPDVDRYGFINKVDRNSCSGAIEPIPPRRVSTILQIASDTPRKTRGLSRAPSAGTIAPKNSSDRKYPSKIQRINAPDISQTLAHTGERIRYVAHCFPGNRDRRLVDEAANMLTLPPASIKISGSEEPVIKIETPKRKEWERAEKWRKMAKVLTPTQSGGGMEFDFDTNSSKLIQRTWKGIPDRWRAAAWYSFLRTSAKNHHTETEEQIIESFNQLLQDNSADDVQIDIDVPRTISGHIMFRKRYRGGQRLLFRVLHCVSLYFPTTGYVQGMASLAATLLCYYDEERAFVMLVRMWTLRGMIQLYDPGFSGLMTALKELHSEWVNNPAVVKKLQDLCIDPTSYGTRWYLTLFNHSVPFAAQLRVWDVFMLLGDAGSTTQSPERPFGSGLAILHATSAALIDATREILLESDFETAMKVLTSWIPIRDEELLMKVARAEWKLHQQKV
ncbi:hypothetical protein K3495_g8257 [Podosphaera aphanis]|nr:hypothetical protein K3495_g8257 [Podosphaera aphanis]